MNATPTEEEDATGDAAAEGKAPSIVRSSIERKGEFDGPPDVVNVVVRYRPTPGVIDETTVQFDVDQDQVARVLPPDDGPESHDEITRFIATVFASREIKELPSITDVADVPSVEHIHNQLGMILSSEDGGRDSDTHISQTPSDTPGEQGDTHQPQTQPNRETPPGTEGEERASPDAPRVTQQESDGEKAPSAVGQSIDSVEAQGDSQQTNTSEEAAGTGGQPQPQPTEGDGGVDVEVQPTEASGTNTASSDSSADTLAINGIDPETHIYHKLPDEWRPDNETADEVIAHIINKTSQDRIAVWNNENNSDISGATVIYYFGDSDEQAEHVAETGDEVINRLFDWVQNPPTPD